MHCFDTDSSCSQFDEGLADRMPLLISFSSFSVYVINSYVNADANMETEQKIPNFNSLEASKMQLNGQNTNLGVTHFDFITHLF